MQNRYSGDIGDFGKLGLLRWAEGSGLSIGVNWYLVPDETHSNDGKHTSYLKKETFRACDDELWRELQSIVDSGNREIRALEKRSILNARFFSDTLEFSNTTPAGRNMLRQQWHTHALEQLKHCDLVFLDPDNGLMVPSARGSVKANKFVLPLELADYYRQGSSIVYYQHKARLSDSYYIEQFKSLTTSGIFSEAKGLGLKFVTTSQRYFFILMQPQHIERITDNINQFLNSEWGSHFMLLYPKDS